RSLESGQYRTCASYMVALPCPILFRAESQQHVAAHAASRGISGHREQHASGDYRSRDVDSAAVSRNAVDGLKLAGGIEIPRDVSIRSGICPQVAVFRSREHRPWNRRDGGGLCGTAGPTVPAAGRGSLPNSLPVVHAESEHSPALIRIELVAAVVAARFARHFEADIGERDIHAAAIGSGAPFDAAHRTAFADLAFP